MLVALIYMYTQAGSFEVLDFHALKLSLKEQVLIFIAFLLAFAVQGADCGPSTPGCPMPTSRRRPVAR